MRQTPIALLMLLMGAAIGTLIGFAVGSGKAMQPGVVSAGYESIERSTQPTSTPVRIDEGPRAMSAREVAQPTFGESLELAPLDDHSPNGMLATEIAIDAEREAQAASDPNTTKIDKPRSITGVVLNERGEPLSGVTLTTLMRPNSSLVRTKSTVTIAQDWQGEADLSESLKEEAVSTLEKRRLRRVATSDESGRFALTNLLPGRHYIYAYKKGYLFRNRSAYVGTTTSLTGAPAQRFHLEVVDGDGNPIDVATIGVSTSDRWTYYEWNAKNPFLPLRERSVKLRAFAGGPLLGDDDQPYAKLASEERRVHLDMDGDGPHRFEVLPTRSLCLTVVDKTADGPTLPHSVRFAEVKKLEENGGRSEFRRNSRSIKMDGDGLYRIATLERGEYVLGVGRGSGQPEVFREFVVDEGPVEEIVELPPVKIEDFIIVKAFSPSGVALSGMGFTLWTLREGRARSHGLSATERRPGEHWVARPRDDGYWEGPARITMRSAAYGALVEPISRDQRTLRADFLEPCNLRVNVAADAEKTFLVTLKVGESFGAEGRITLENGRPKMTKGQGFVTFEGIQPGLAQLMLNAEGESYWRNDTPRLAQVEVPLRSGEQEASISASLLHTLEIHAPDENPGTRFSVTALGEQANLSFGVRRSGTVGPDHLATITKLPPGRYELGVYGGQVPSIEISIPSSVLTYERPETVGYRVSLRRKGRDIAPLAVGDVITAVNGEAVALGSFTSRIKLALAEGPTTLTLTRDGESLEVPIEKYTGYASYTAVDTID